MNRTAWVAAAMLLGGVARAQTLPAGFTRDILPTTDASGVSAAVLGPTKLAIAADGRIFVAEHHGRVRIIKEGRPLRAPFLTLPSGSVDISGSRGVMGIALHPGFASNGWVYVHYTHKNASGSRNRISRFTASASNPDVAELGAGGIPAETVIFEMSPQGASTIHNSGPMVFREGKLYIATGENNVPSNAQLSTHTGGKVLRLNDDGSPPADNPLAASGDPVERRLWARGLRNPWTLTVDPTSGRIFANDIGSDENTRVQPWEEVNLVAAPPLAAVQDLGWPITEGEGPHLPYRYPNGPGEDGQDCAIVGGAFHPASGPFGPGYHGAFFFGDHCSGWIRYLPSGAQAVGADNQAQPFASNLGAALVDLALHPDGSLIYIARASVIRDHDAAGIVGRIRRTSVPLPSVQILSPANGARFPAPASFLVSASASDASGITRLELLVDGAAVAEVSAAAHDFPLSDLPAGLYRLSARATNALGGVRESGVVEVGVSGPTAEILTPAEGTRYVAGASVAFSGQASDPEDGALPPSALEWNVLLHHGSHTHPAFGPVVGADGAFVPDADDETDHDVHYVIYLTATDASGVRHTVSRAILPIKAEVTVTSSPPALSLLLDGGPRETPFSFTGVAGVHRRLEAPLFRFAGGQGWRWSAWSNGGPRDQQIATPVEATTFSASYTLLPLPAMSAFYRFVPDPSDLRRVVDSLGGAAGTAVNGPTWVSESAGGKQWRTLAFDGDNDRVDLPRFGGSASGSVSFWVKTASGQSFKSTSVLYYGSPSTKGDGNGSADELHVHFTSASKLGFLVRSGTTTVSLASPASYNDGQWHHVAATWNVGASGATPGGTVVLYVDGAAVRSAGYNTPRAASFGFTSFHRLARYGASKNRPLFSGQLDELRIFSAVLTADQVAALAADSRAD